MMKDPVLLTRDHVYLMVNKEGFHPLNKGSHKMEDPVPLTKDHIFLMVNNKGSCPINEGSHIFNGK